MYSEDKQQLILQFLLSNDDVYARCQNILDPDYFEQALKPVVRYIKEYSNTYQAVPSSDFIKAETGMSFTRLPDELTTDSRHVNGFLTMFEEFCRHRALENAIYKSSEFLKDGKYGDVELAVKNAIMISLQKNLGTNYWADPKGRIEYMRTKDAKISTGWKAIDDVLYGGFDKGALNIFAGSSGMGKSLFLQNMMRIWSNAGLNVVYISLELPEDLIALRLDAMETNIQTREIFKRVDEVELKVKMHAKKSGARQIKQMPQGSTTNDIRAYLKEYTIQSGIQPDALIVDYLDLLHPSAHINLSDTFTKDKMISEELRGLATELGLYLVTASQLNRGATVEAKESGGGKPEYDHSHIAGGISKINTADVVMTLYKDKKMDDAGMYCVQFIKTRSSNGVGRRIFLGFDHSSLIIHDIDQPPEEDEIPSLNKVDSAQMLSTVKQRRQDINDRLNKKKEEENLYTAEEKKDATEERNRILDRIQQIKN